MKQTSFLIAALMASTIFAVPPATNAKEHAGGNTGMSDTQTCPLKQFYREANTDVSDTEHRKANCSHVGEQHGKSNDEAFLRIMVRRIMSDLNQNQSVEFQTADFTQNKRARSGSATDNSNGQEVSKTESESGDRQPEPILVEGADAVIAEWEDFNGPAPESAQVAFQDAPTNQQAVLSVSIPAEATEVILEHAYVFWTENPKPGKSFEGGECFASSIQINGETVTGALITETDKQPPNHKQMHAYVARLPEPLWPLFEPGRNAELVAAANAAPPSGLSLPEGVGVVVPYGFGSAEENVQYLHVVGDNLNSRFGKPFSDVAVFDISTHLEAGASCFNAQFLFGGRRDGAQVWLVEGSGEVPENGLSFEEFIHLHPEAWDNAVSLIETELTEGLEEPGCVLPRELPGAVETSMTLNGAETDWIAFIVQAPAFESPGKGMPQSKRYTLTWPAMALALGTDCANGGGEALPPTAVLGVSPLSGPAPLEVSLDAGESSGPEGRPLSYTWDFGDGQSAGPEADPSMMHTYAQPGTYTVELTVSDGSASDTASATVEVTEGTGGNGDNGDNGGNGGGGLPAPQLSAPATAPASGESFVMDWNDVTGAAIYELVMAGDANFDPVFAGFFPGISEETVSGQVPGTYVFRVRAWDALPEDGGTPGAWSDVVTVTVLSHIL